MFMKAKKFENKIIIRIDKGEEIVESLTRICKEFNITFGSVSGIGAANKIKVGLFDPDTKEYYSKEFEGNFEISPLSGNVTAMNDEIYLHLHINFCDANHISFGGHLNSAIVSATSECIIEITNGAVERKYSDEIGLNLLEI
jgi:predicted DNA-binding protein with PD1-like motif